MIPNLTDQVEITGSLASKERTHFGLHSDSIAHLMSILTDLYSDPALAVVREYSTNAIDSHIAAGTTRPIEVTLPTAMAPTLTIRDFGLGMSRETIEQKYGQYGFSTKRETDAQNGMLGLGCKSALTFTTQFTIKAVHDGMKTITVVSRDETGVGFLQVVSHNATDAGNGVEIAIPVPLKQVNAMRETAAEFFSYWNPEHVLIDGEAPKTFLERAADEGYTVIKIDDDVYVLNDYTQSRVVMGNVAYPIPTRDLMGDSVDGSRWRVVVFTPMGSVNFTPSREALHMTNTTKDTVQTIRDYVLEAYARQVQVEVDALESISEAAAFLNQSGKFIQRSAFRSARHGKRYLGTWRGVPIPEHTNIYGYQWTSVPLDNPATRTRGAKNTHQLAQYHLVVTGAGRVTAKMKAQADQYVVRNQIGEQVYGTYRARILFVETCDSDALQFFNNVVPLSTIRDEKLPSTATGPAVKTKFRRITKGGLLHVDEVPTTCDALVMVPASATSLERANLTVFATNMSNAIGCDPFFASVYKGQDDAFLKRNPTAITIAQWLEKIRPEIEVLYIPELQTRFQEAGGIKTVSADSVVDPDLKEYFRIRNVRASAQQNTYEVTGLIGAFNDFARSHATGTIDGSDVSDMNATLRRVVDRYPLAFIESYLTARYANHVWIDYCNDTFAGVARRKAMAQIDAQNDFNEYDYLEASHDEDVV